MAKQGVKRRIVVVRHAERADEAPLERVGTVGWTRSRASYDPPLTRRGEEMARLAASHVAAVTVAGASAGSVAPYDFTTSSDSADSANSGKRPVTSNPYRFQCIHVSPLLRCLQTASAIAKALGGLPLEVDQALSSCAKRVRSAEAAGRPLVYAVGEERREAAGGLEVRDRPCSDTALSSIPSASSDVELCAPGLPRFVECVQRLAREAPGTGGLLVVTHREGIRELDRLAGEPRHETPYCAVHEYDFDLETGTWTLVHNEELRPTQAAELRKRKTNILQDYKFAYVAQAGKPKSHSRCAVM